MHDDVKGALPACNGDVTPEVRGGSCGAAWGDSLDVSNDKGSVQFDGNGEGSKIKEGKAPGALKTWARWSQKYARWTVDFDAVLRP